MKLITGQDNRFATCHKLLREKTPRISQEWISITMTEGQSSQVIPSHTDVDKLNSTYHQSQNFHDCSLRRSDAVGQGIIMDSRVPRDARSDHDATQSG